MTRRPLRVLTLLLAIVSGPAHTALAQVVGNDPALRALSHGNVYVDPHLNGVDAAVLRQAVGQGGAKIAVLATRPPGHYPSRDAYTLRLHDALHMGRSGLVLVLPSGRGRGVSVEGLGTAQDSRLVQQYGPQVERDVTHGTAALAQAVAAQSTTGAVADTTGGHVTSTNTGVGQPTNSGTATGGSGYGGTILMLTFLIIAAIVVALIVSASRRKKADLSAARGPVEALRANVLSGIESAARGPVEALRANVLSGIEYIDHYTDVLPKGNPDSEVARTARQAAEDKYEQATQVLARAAGPQDLNRAQGILDRAQADIQQARGALDRALGGTKNIPGDDAFRPPPLPQNQEQVNAIPTGQRGVSFFSGEPAPLGALVPVTVTVGGQQRQVYATPGEAAELRAGRMPQVRAFNVNNQYVPWYEYNAYDPYRDYWQYQNRGWGGGFGGGALAGFIGAELLMDAMTPAFGYGGYGGYAFSPDMGAMSYDQGFAAGQSYDQGYAAGQASDYGNAGFGGGDPGGGYDFGSDANTNASDPGGGYDFGGGGDPGGGFDFGGGGGDFGGGGDSGGGGDF